MKKRLLLLSSFTLALTLSQSNVLAQELEIPEITATQAEEENEVYIEETVNPAGYEVENVETDLDNGEALIEELPIPDQDICDDCEIDATRKETTDKVDLNAEIVFTENDYDNVTVVKNPNNAAHDPANPHLQTSSGPGELEYNYWNSNKYANNYDEHYRINFATEYGIDNAVMTAEFDFNQTLEELYNLGLISFENSSRWLVGTENPQWGLFRGESLYDKVITEIPTYTISGNRVTFELGNVDARTALSIAMKRVFNNEEDYDANVRSDSRTQVTGNWTRTLPEEQLPGKKVTATIERFDNIQELFGDQPLVVGTEVVNETPITNETSGPTKNGFTAMKRTTSRITGVTTLKDQNGNDILDENGNLIYCYEVEYTEEVLNSFSMEAESVMDTTIPDYSNNGYETKVKSPHIDANAGELSGPGNIEVQHWQNGPNEATTAQFWRIVYATDNPFEMVDSLLNYLMHWTNMTILYSVMSMVASSQTYYLKMYQ